MIGIPVSEDELDEIESAALALRDAIRAKDMDTAYIIASTSEHPAMLAMMVAAVSYDPVHIARVLEEVPDLLDDDELAHDDVP